MTKFTTEQIQKQIGMEILCVSKFIRGSREEQIHGAKKIVSALLKTSYKDMDKLKVGTQQFAIKQAVGLIDTATGLQRTYPEKKSESSYTKSPQTTSTSQDKNNSEDSKYQSKQECISDMTSQQGLSAADAETACSQIFGDSDTEQRAKGSNKRSASIPAAFRINPYHKEWNERIEELANERIRSAKLSIGLKDDVAGKLKTISDFQQGTYVPKSEVHTKSAAYNTNVSNEIIRNRDKIIARQQLEAQNKSKAIHSAGVDNVTPSWIKARNFSLSRMSKEFQ